MKIRYLIANSILGRFFLRIASKQKFNHKGALKILIYHDIPYRDFDKFEAQIKFIARQYGFVSPDDLQKILNGQVEYTGVRVLLTFDDGFKSNALLAEKVLDPLGIKAIFFIPVGFINMQKRDGEKPFIAENIYNNHIVIENIPDEMAPMNWQDLKGLLSHGHTIGAHTINHRRLSRIKSENELRREITESGNMLQEKLGVSINHFSFPFGDIDSIDQRAMRIIRERYKYCYSGIRGNNHMGSSPFAILRDLVSVDDPLSYFQFVINNGLELLYKKKALVLAKEMIA